MKISQGESRQAALGRALAENRRAAAHPGMKAGEYLGEHPGGNPGEYPGEHPGGALAGGELFAVGAWGGSGGTAGVRSSAAWGEVGYAPGPGAAVAGRSAGVDRVLELPRALGAVALGGSFSGDISPGGVSSGDISLGDVSPRGASPAGAFLRAGSGGAASLEGGSRGEGSPWEDAPWGEEKSPLGEENPRTGSWVGLADRLSQVLERGSRRYSRGGV